MIRLDVKHGSPEWEQARLGMPTASAFDKILTPAKLEVSKDSAKYRNQLVSEWLLGHPIDWNNSSGFMDRGTNMEAEAVAFYELRNDVEVTVGGFITRDDGKVGGSPDGLVGEDGGLEIKCPAIHTHIGYMQDPQSLAAAYRLQVNGYLYLTGRPWWEIISYNPILPAVIIAVTPDERVQAALHSALGVFLTGLDALKEELAAYRVGAPEEFDTETEGKVIDLMAALKDSLAAQAAT